MLVLGLFLGFFLLFTLNLGLSDRLAAKNQFLANFGEKLYLKKETQYNNSPLFASLRKAVVNKNFTQAFLVIFPLMLLKSAAFYFLGLFLLLPVMLIVQGIMMGALLNYYKKQKPDSKLFMKITLWQLSSHLIIAVYGFIKGSDWLLGTDLFNKISPSILQNIWFYIALSVIWAIVAAYLEVTFLIKKHPF